MPGPVLTIGRVGDATSLDPSQATDDLSLRITHEVFSNLVSVRPGTADVVPAIARAWSVSGDGKTWTFRLAPAQHFSDGTPLDAAAVKFNLERWRDTRDPAHGSGRYAAFVADFGGFDGACAIASVAAPAPGTLVLSLRAPVRALLHDLAQPAFGIGSPAAIRAGAAAFAEKPVAAGPYEVARWVRGEYVRLTVNPFWRGPKPAYADVWVRDIPDPPTTVLALKKFDIDILAGPRPQDVDVLARAPGVVLYRAPGDAATVSFAAKDSIDGIVASPDGFFNLITIKPKAVP